MLVVAWRGLRLAVVCAAAVVLAACANLTPEPPAPVAAPVVVSLEGWMAQADQALKQDRRDAAREAYRSAARAYPAAKEPWQRLAEDYFNVRDYGNAVLAGEEVLQRDPQDQLAHSILAVSGLRITAGSLKALRKDAPYNVGSRDEALSVTRSLREALGETTLVPNTPVTQAEPTSPLPRRPVVAPRKPAVQPTPAAAQQASRVPSNPLDKLK